MKMILSLLLCSAFIGTAQAQTPTPTQVQAKPYLDIQEIKTPKGLSVWFVQDKNIPVMTLKFSLKGGAQLDPPGKEGTAELLSALFDEGAGKRDAETFQNVMDEYGIKIGFSATRDSFNGNLKTTTQHRDMADELFDDALNRPQFTDEAVARMKAALLSSLRFQRMDPNWLANKKLFETLFAGQAYARPVEGTPETLPKLTAGDLRGEKDTLFCRQRLKIAIVGALEKQEVIDTADLFFGNWPECKTPVVDAPQIIKNAGKDIHVPWDGAQSVVVMAQPGIARQDKDWWAARILDFALGGGEFSSRLMEEVRVKRGLTYGVSSGIAPYDRAPLWLVQAGVDPAKTDEAISVIKKIWGEVSANGLTDEEIKQAKDYLIGSLPLALTSTDAIASVLLQLQE
ncbi:MAG: putative peptidase, partial [Alphaproteobacteria bacterium]|nr:putative peptidase [Alphaproteobacteria bacterium]